MQIKLGFLSLLKDVIWKIFWEKTEFQKYKESSLSELLLKWLGFIKITLINSRYLNLSVVKLKYNIFLKNFVKKQLLIFIHRDLKIWQSDPKPKLQELKIRKKYLFYEYYFYFVFLKYKHQRNEQWAIYRNDWRARYDWHEHCIFFCITPQII